MELFEVLFRNIMHLVALSFRLVSVVGSPLGTCLKMLEERSRTLSFVKTGKLSSEIFTGLEHLLLEQPFLCKNRVTFLIPEKLILLSTRMLLLLRKIIVRL